MGNRGAHGVFHLRLHAFNEIFLGQANAQAFHLACERGGPLLLRSHLPDDLSFRGLLERARAVVQEARTHAPLSYAELVKGSKESYDLSRAPFLQVMFRFRSSRGNSALLGRLRITPADFAPMLVAEAGVCPTVSSPPLPQPLAWPCRGQ